MSDRHPPRALIAFLLFFGLTVNPGQAQQPRPAYPHIQALNPRTDPLFKQFEDQLALSRRRQARHEAPPDLSLYEYVLGDEEDLFTLAARTTLPYDTLVTLNGWSRTTEAVPGIRVLIPTREGLFLPLQPQSEIHRLLENRLSEQSPERLQFPHLGTRLFFPGQRLSPLERAYLLGILFRFPLPERRITSAYGPRSNPFTGHPSYHNGLDLGAPRGTEVYAARDGQVIESGFDRVYGVFVVLSHAGGYESLYGHLETSHVTLNQRIPTGYILGTVGSTGLATGPHLHFEIRRNGRPTDPTPLLRP